MSGIHSISETSNNFTILGRGPDTALLKKTQELSLVHIVRGRKYQRLEDIRHLASLGYFDTLVLMPRDSTLPYEELVSEYPNLRLLLFPPEDFSQLHTPGSLVNRAISEASAQAVLVTWGGTVLSLSPQSLKHVDRNTLCYVPQLRSESGSLIPSLFIPTGNQRGAQQRRGEPIPVLPDGREQESLFPADYIGLYIKERFERSGGYDEAIRNPHWQKLEFGYRTRLWGEKIRVLSGFRADYLNEPGAEESTPDQAYLTMYLRVLAIRYTGDRAYLPISRFWSFFRAGNRGLLPAWEEFSKQRAWVHRHRYKYQGDFRQMAELWGE